MKGGIRGGVAAGLRGLAAGGVAGVERALNEDRIRLAVTGLSRAGKTVFITSLIQNLLALGQGRNTLPRITARLSQNGLSRLRSIEVMPAGAGVLPFFDYPSKLRNLAASAPSWPPRTEDLAQVSLALEIGRQSALGQKLGSRRIRLDILDCPGEWLLDLPMLDQSYAEWSAQTLALLRTPPRLDCSAVFLALTEDLRAGDRAEESLLSRGHTLYREALHRCRDEHGLRYLQPGRFICPGPNSDAPFMWFFPLSVPPGPPRPGSVAALLQERFTTYQRHVRTSFFDTHFASFDRQIMLVDVLGALYSGRAAFEDTARVIHDLAAALRYGSNTLPRAIAAGMAHGAGQLLPSLLGRAAGGAAQKLSNRRIERVVFVATKADHVPALRRDNVLHLLRSLVDAGAGRSSVDAAGASHRVAASILSTTDGVVRTGETAMEVVHGIVLGEENVRPFFVGDVPASVPPETFWADRFLAIPVFKPPVIDPDGATGIPHLNLDLVLDDVIGDLL
jgi:predicted YcjX-like family ATPase